MKSKLDLAHDYAMNFIGAALRDDVDSDFNHNLISISSWDYADAMYEQQEQREIKSHDELKSNLVDSINTDFANDLAELSQHRRNADWQPDWSQAPDWADSFRVTEYQDDPRASPCLVGVWEGGGKSKLTGTTFSFKGSWQNSLRKRPEVK